MPEVSVIIPVYNKARYVGRAIKSVLSQTFGDYEIIIVDDGSTDKSLDVVKGYAAHPKVQVVRQENKGCPAALNKGIALAKGRYICWLSADDLWHENKLEMQIKVFKDDKNIGLVYTDAEYIDENGNIIHSHVKSAEDQMPLPLRVMGINGSSVMVKRECMEKIGLFNEELKCSNDTDYWYRLGKRFRMKRLSIPLIQSRQKGERLSDDEEAMVKYFSIYLVKNGLPLEIGLTRLANKDPKLVRLNYIEGKNYLSAKGKNYYFYRTWTFLFRRGWHYALAYYLPVFNRKYELFKKETLGIRSLRGLFSASFIIKAVSKMRKRRLLFIYPHDPITTFEAADKKILANNFITRALCHPDSRNKWARLKMLFAVLRADVVVSWFADWHSYHAVKMCRLLKKKSIIILGGYDISAIPQIGYGIASKRPHHLYMVRNVLDMSDGLVANSQFARRELLGNFDVDKGKVYTIYHGFDVDLPEEDSAEIKENIVLTVVNINKTNLLLKGLIPFVKSAMHLPNMRFVLVGPDRDGSIPELEKIAPRNVEFFGELHGESLKNMYRRSKVYVQISMCESFGCALAEAMLCECVPVVTREGALPEVVGECGYYVSANNSKEVALAIKEASSNLYLGKQARNRIINKFPLNKREEALRELINSTL